MCKIDSKSKKQRWKYNKIIKSAVKKREKEL